MGLGYQDRVIIKYEKVKGSKKPIPIIGKDLAFDEEGSGNKITKSNSISYRGNANTILNEYGTQFKIIKTAEEGIWKLISTSEKELSEDSYDQLLDEIEKVDFTVITEEDENMNINEMTFKL
jgi:hypothetical protein